VGTDPLPLRPLGATGLATLFMGASFLWNSSFPLLSFCSITNYLIFEKKQDSVHVEDICNLSDY